MKFWALLLGLFLGIPQQTVPFHTGATVANAVPGANTYCGPGDSLQNAGADGPSLGIQTCFYTALVGSPSNGTIHNLVTSTDLTNCLAGSASCPGGTPACGDIFSLQAGNTFSGNFTFGTWAAVCSSSSWVRIQTSAISSIPGETARINPSYIGISCAPVVNGLCTTGLIARPAFSGGSSNVLAKIQTPNTSPALKFGLGVDYIRFIGIEWAQTCSGPEVARFVDFQGNSVNHIIFDRNIPHGCSDKAAGAETQKFVGFDSCNYCALIDSYAYNFYCVTSTGSCTDAHVIGGGTNTNASNTDHAWKIVNNFLEGAAESVFSGGGTASIIPADSEVRLNHFFKPLTWDPSDPSYNGGISINGNGTQPAYVKNQLEYKNMNGALIEGNYIENVWAGFSQDGAAILLNPKSQSPGNQCPICEVQNITLRYNWIKTAVQYSQVDNIAAGGFYASNGGNYSDHDNVAENLGPANCNFGNNAAQSGLSVYSGPNATNPVNHITRNHLTLVWAATQCFPTHTPSTMLGFDGPIGPTQTNIIWENIIDVAGQYGSTGILGIGNKSCGFAYGNNFANGFNACYSSSTFDYNGIIGGASNINWIWPGSHNVFPTSASSVFVNYNNGLGGDYHILNTSPLHNAGNDGLDMGANISKVISYTNPAI